MDHHDPYNNHDADVTADDYCGNVEVLSLSYIEIQPLRPNDVHPHEATATADAPGTNDRTAVPLSPPALTAAFIKRQLILDTHRALFTRTTHRSETSSTSTKSTPQCHSQMVMTRTTTQVIPTTNTSTHSNQYVITGSLVMVVGGRDGDTHALPVNNDNEENIIWFRTNEPIGPSTFWPCHCTGTAILHRAMDRTVHSILTTPSSRHRPVLVTESTLVVIRLDHPMYDTVSLRHDTATIELWKDQ